MRGLGRRALAGACCVAVAATWARPAAAASAQELLEAARQAFDQKAYGRAAGAARRVAEQYAASPEAEEAMLVWIDALIEEGSLSRAYRVCERMLREYPRSKHRTAALRRELVIGSAVARTSANFYLFRLPRHREGVAILDRVLEHAPFGPLADDAILAIADAHLRRGYYEEAIEQYDRLLTNYRDSPLALRARVGRALANFRWGEEAPYDTRPAEEARREYELLTRESGDEAMEQRRKEMTDLLARYTYEAGLFYVRRRSLKGAVRYMRTVIEKYPESEYAQRAQRIIATIREAQGEEKP